MQPSPVRIATRAQVWVARASPGAEATAARVSAAGHGVLVAPVLAVRPLPGAKVRLEGVDALAFTSANAVRAFTRLEPRRDLTAFCVGAATADAAREAGLSAVSADGDATALSATIAAALPAGAEVVHPCGADLAGDLAGLLAGSGVRLRPLPLYQTVAAEALPADVAAALDASALDVVLIHSPKAGRVVAGLLAAVTPSSLAGMRVLAISPAALAPLEALPFAALRSAIRPDETALLALLAP